MASNPQWQPNATVLQFAIIVDSNGNIQQCIVPGLTNSTPPIWPTSLGSTITDGTASATTNAVTWQLVVLFQPAVTIPASSIPVLPPPIFVNDEDGLDPNQILADMKAEFEGSANRVLQPAQVEMLLINLYAYRESIIRNAIQYAGQQNLLAYALYPMIDYLGALLGVTRLTSQSAVTTLIFTLTTALTVPYTIPAGTLVGTEDGLYQFATVAAVTVHANSTVSPSVNAVATQGGTGGNGYVIGEVSILLNPNPQITAVQNTSTTGGGSEIETDDHLRARIQAAPNQFSVAGPEGAYRFFALGVDPSIIDVSITSPQPGP